jgi:hypothetical protein
LAALLVLLPAVRRLMVERGQGFYVGGMVEVAVAVVVVEVR